MKYNSAIETIRLIIDSSDMYTRQQIVDCIFKEYGRYNAEWCRRNNEISTMEVYKKVVDDIEKYNKRKKKPGAQK